MFGIGGLIGRDALPTGHQLMPENMTLKSMNEELELTKKRIAEQKEMLKDATAMEKFWKGLRETAENGIRKYKEADDKWMENYEKQQKRNAENMKKLTDKRSNLLLDIEDDYTQQGVDLLTSMGKAGKYMSAMEMASLNQDRFSPITKKMDDM